METLQITAAMEDLKNRLEDIGLQDYFTSFVQEGFDNWETILDIMESDLEALHVKLGHRRKLQRAIFIYRRSATNDALSTAVSDSARVDGHSRTAPASPEPTTGKRKYKRHPKPDGNAPEKPLSAYVQFSNDVRRELDDKEVSFAEMAKIVGERWKALPTETRESYESMAQAAKAKYQDELALYKKTERYREYQNYLADFKSRSKQPRNENDPQDFQTMTSHSRASSSSEIASLMDRTSGVSFSESFARQPSSSSASASASQRDPRDDHTTTKYASHSSRTTRTTRKTWDATSAAAAMGRQPAFLRSAHSDPTPSSLSAGSVLLPPIASLNRQHSAGAIAGTAHPGFEIDSGPMDGVTALLPRPRISNTRMSEEEGGFHEGDMALSPERGGRSRRG